jgi:hypothetical protein
MDFSATLHDVKEGVGDIVEVQRLEQQAGALVRDYYQTAKKKGVVKGE